MSRIASSVRVLSVLSVVVPLLGPSLIAGATAATSDPPRAEAAPPVTAAPDRAEPLLPPGLRVVDAAAGPGLPAGAVAAVLAMDERWTPAILLVDGSGRVVQAVAVPREATIRREVALAVHDGRPVVAGGFDADPDGTASADVLALPMAPAGAGPDAPPRDLPPLPEPRALHAVTGTASGLLVVGGETGPSAAAMTPAADALRLASDGTWNRIPLPGPRLGGIAVDLGDRAVVLGGRAARDGEPVLRVDVIDVDGGVRSWTPAMDGGGAAPLPVAATVVRGDGEPRVRAVDGAGALFELRLGEGGGGGEGEGEAAWQWRRGGRAAVPRRLGEGGGGGEGEGEAAWQWRRVGSAAWPRRFAELAPGDDGAVLLLGGFRGARPVRAVERIAGAAGDVTATGAAASMGGDGDDGKVVVAGPYVIPGPPLPPGRPSQVEVGAAQDLGAMLEGVMLLHASDPAGGGFTWTLDTPQLDWQPLGGVPQAVRAATIATDGNRAFLFGPHGSPAVPAYRVGERGWAWREPGPPPHAEGAAFVAHAMRWYAFGGERDGRATDAITGTAWIDDTAPFTPVGATLPAARRDAAAAGLGGGIVIAGGIGADGRAVAEVVRYDPVERVLAEMPALPQPAVLGSLRSDGQTGALLAVPADGRGPWLLARGAERWTSVDLPGDPGRSAGGALVAGGGDAGFLLLRRLTDGRTITWRVRPMAE